MNIQYAVAHDVVYILEANPRASRTVPLVSKVCNIPMARIATQILMGAKLADLNLSHGKFPSLRRQGIGVPVQHVPGSGPRARPGDAIDGRGLGHGQKASAWPFAKAQEAAGGPLPSSGKVLITVADDTKPGILETARQLRELGFSIVATRGTQQFLTKTVFSPKSVSK